MRRLLNPKRVTWASDVNLCQVRLFLSEESPSQVGLGAQDHLQAKSSWTSQTSGITSDDNLPPGFEGAQASNLWRTKLAQIPLVKWELPTRFILEPSWRVVAGEESQEVEVQKQREMRVLEAIYPRPSAIPLNPSVPAENFVHNDQQTPLIPITPIEEEDGGDTSQDAVAPNANLMEAGAASSHGPSNNLPVNGITATGAAPSLEPDVLAVAQAALSAIMANDQGNLIDRELLMKILGDPQIIGQLVRHHGGGGGGGGATLQSMPAAATTQPRPAASVPSMPAMGVHNMPATAMQNMSNMRPPGFGFSTPTPPPINRVDPSSAHGNRPDLVPPSIPGTSTAPFNPPPGRLGSIPNMRPPMPDVLSTSTSSVRAPLQVTPSTSSSSGGPAKDINYYKSLIQQHGGERQDAPPPPPFSNRSNHHLDSVQEQPINSRSRDSKPKIMKPCIYFNSSRGCRHGVNCAYLHDGAPSQQRVANMPEVQNAKRMKMDREITGT